VTILLRQGSSGDLQDVKPVTTDARGGSFTWTPDNDIKGGNTYAFQIRQKDQTNYTALLKSAGQPAAAIPEAKDTTNRKDATFETGTSTGITAGTTAGTTGTNAALNAQVTDGTHATQGTHTTMTSTTSKDLISSSANLSGSPSSSAAASSTERMMASGTNVVNGKEASSTGSMQNAASNLQYSVQLVIGIASLLAYLV
jgi:hypothetical protein